MAQSSVPSHEPACPAKRRRGSDEEAAAAEEGGAIEQRKVLTFEIGASQHGGGHLRQMHERLGRLSYLLTG